MRIVDVVEEPRDELYRGLVRLAPRFCTSALLVVRPARGDRLGDRGVRLMSQLQSWLIETGERSEWPGTRLIGHPASVFTYRLDPGFIEALDGAVAGLYEWRQPELPEDLCLLRADGSPWLVTIAHERDAYFRLDDIERAELVSALPRIEPLLRAREARGSSPASP
jgi:hypothetical protein